MNPISEMSIAWLRRVTGTKEATWLVIHELQAESAQTAQTIANKAEDHEDHKLANTKCEWARHENYEREIAMNGNLTRPENNILTLIQ